MRSGIGLRRSGGLCPQCLILGAFESSVSADESGTRTIDTATAAAGDDDFGRYLDRADPEKGRFRSFLLTSLKFFVADEEDRRRAHKRGGGAVLPLELSSGEDRYQREPKHDETPERIFARRWALSVLDRVVERLRNEFVQHGRPEHFERLKMFLIGKSDAPYAALAREMNTSEGALKVAIHRLRKRYRELFRQEIADTVADPGEVESELRFLASALTRK